MACCYLHLRVRAARHRIQVMRSLIAMGRGEIHLPDDLERGLEDRRLSDTWTGDAMDVIFMGDTPVQALFGWEDYLRVYRPNDPLLQESM